MHGLAPVEQQRLHRAVVEQEQLLAHAQLAHRLPVGALEHVAAGHRRAHHQQRHGARRDRGGQRVAAQPPLAVLDVEAGERRHAAGQPHAVHEPGVGRVGEHDLVAAVDRREQDVEHGLGAAAGDHDLGLRVVAVAGARGEVVGDRGAQVGVAREGQPRVGLRALDRRGGDGGRLRRERQVGVQVLEPQQPVVARRAGGGRDAVDAEAGHLREAAGPWEVARGGHRHLLVAVMTSSVPPASPPIAS